MISFNPIKNAFALTICLISLTTTSVAYSQTISEEARRYMDRGQAAVETAKTATDYEDAIMEFEKAAKLAPDWADVYYNLGIVQEKANRYASAMINLKKYLQLAPNAPDVKQVQALINKIEYKQEKSTNERQLAEKKKEILNNFNIEEWDEKVVFNEQVGLVLSLVTPRQIRGDGEKYSVKVVEQVGKGWVYYWVHPSNVKFNGEFLEYEFVGSVCGGGQVPECDYLVKCSMEIVSDKLIKIKVKSARLTRAIFKDTIIELRRKEAR